MHIYIYIYFFILDQRNDGRYWSGKCWNLCKWKFKLINIGKENWPLEKCPIRCLSKCLTIRHPHYVICLRSLMQSGFPFTLLPPMATSNYLSCHSLLRPLPSPSLLSRRPKVSAISSIKLLSLPLKPSPMELSVMTLLWMLYKLSIF